MAASRLCARDQRQPLGAVPLLAHAAERVAHAVDAGPLLDHVAKARCQEQRAGTLRAPGGWPVSNSGAARTSRYTYPCSLTSTWASRADTRTTLIHPF